MAAASCATRNCLVGDLLQGDRILGPKLLIAREIGLRLGMKGGVLGQLSLRLRQSRLVETRVDLGEDVALLDRLAFGKIDLLEHARHLALDRGRIQGLNRSNARKHDWLVVLLHLRGDDRDRGCGAGAGGLVSDPAAEYKTIPPVTSATATAVSANFVQPRRII